MAAKSKDSKGGKGESERVRPLIGSRFWLWAVIIALGFVIIPFLGRSCDGSKPPCDQPPNGNGGGQTVTPPTQPPPNPPPKCHRPGQPEPATDTLCVGWGEEKTFRLKGGQWYSVKLPEGSSWEIGRWCDIAYRSPDGEVIEAPFGESVEMPCDWEFQIKAKTNATIAIRVL